MEYLHHGELLLGPSGHYQAAAETVCLLVDVRVRGTSRSWESRVRRTGELERGQATTNEKKES